MTKEAKVGAFTLGGILLLAVVLAHLSGFQLGGSSGYRLYVGFTKAVGLVPQSILVFPPSPSKINLPFPLTDITSPLFRDFAFSVICLPERKTFPSDI